MNQAAFAFDKPRNLLAAGVGAAITLEHSMDPLSDACLSLNVKDVGSGQIVGGGWVIRNQAYRNVTFGASLKGSFWVSIDGLDHPILIEEGDCYLVANHHGYRTSSEPEIEAADLRSTLARANSVIWPTAPPRAGSQCAKTPLLPVAGRAVDRGPRPQGPRVPAPSGCGGGKVRLGAPPRRHPGRP
jgi:hypothetical protein